MNKKLKRRLIKWFKIIVLIYIAGGMALYFLQDYILFRPVTLKRNHHFNFNIKYEEIPPIAVNKTDSMSIIRFPTDDSTTKGIVLFFHGNKRNISWYEKYPPFFTKKGYEVWMIDYPGFGKSRGILTEEKLYRWAEYFYAFAVNKYSSDNIIIYGKSMGTGIAAYLAGKKKCKEVILETPYYDFPSVVAHYTPFYPVHKMLHYQLPTYQYIQRITEPITIFQGTDDGLVTYGNAKRLQPFLKPNDEFVTIQGGSHNDLYKFSGFSSKLDSLLR